MSAWGDAFRAADSESRLRALAALAEEDGRRLDGGDLEILVGCLGVDRKAVQRRTADACARLDRGGAKLRPLLVEALRSATARQRWGVAFALATIGELEPVELVGAVFEALGSDDGDVRWAAADIARRLAQSRPDLRDRLCDLLRGDCPEQRKMAFYCLRDLGADGAGIRAAAIAALDEAPEGVTLAALAWMTRLAVGDPDAIRACVRLLGGTNPRLQRAAAMALGSIAAGARESMEILQGALASPDASLSRAAARALRQGWPDRDP